MDKKRYSFFLIFIIACEILTLIQLTIEPSDIENQVFGGYSLNRWMLILFVSGCLIGSLVLLISGQSRNRLTPIVDALFTRIPVSRTNAVFVISILMALFLILSFMPVGLSSDAWGRLRPVMIMVTMFFWGYLGYAVWVFQHKPWLKWFPIFKKNSTGNSRQAPAEGSEPANILPSRWSLILILVFTFPLLFFTAFRFQFPVGYGGLFVIMSESLAEAGFRLPQSVPYYGPGGIPYAYPPVGFYVMAFFTSILHVPVFDYLRFAPALFLWLSLIPLYLSTHEMTNSRPAAVVAAFVVAGSPRIFMIQGTTAGVVRGLAFLFAMWGVYFFLAAIKYKRMYLYAVLCGIFFGLTALTHLSYAEFAVLFVIAYWLLHLGSQRTWVTTFVAGGTAVLTVTPWVLTMVQRYGWEVFTHASQTHGATSFLQLIREPGRIPGWFENALLPLAESPFLGGLIALGLVFALFSAHRIAAFWFLLILVIMSEGDRYLITSGAVLSGGLIGALANSLNQRTENRSRLRISDAFLAICVLGIYAAGWIGITKLNPPSINAASLDLASFVQSNTAEDDKYLIIAGADEAEWFPYLLRRDPVIASWGGEWVGSYNQHLSWVYEVMRCRDQGEWTCLEQVMGELPEQPDMLITHQTDAAINRQLETDPHWSKAFTNQEYILWQE